MKILSIETSCDETAIAVVEYSGSRKTPEISVLSNLVSSQVKLHEKFGGVVPNLAKREHEKNLVPLLIQALKESGLYATSRQMKKKMDTSSATILEREPTLLIEFEKKVTSLLPPNIDAIAVTYGPGLAPALWVGVNFAKALSALWDKPIIPINHMEGHLYSSLIKKEESKWKLLTPAFPALALLVSGGHTELVLVKGYGKYEIIGETLDDAAGEAFDKVARMLGLGYPGGPAIAQEAEKKLGNSLQHIKLPHPMLHSKDFNFSFSGLKTAVLYLLRDIDDKKKIKELSSSIAREFQDAVVDVLVKKTIQAAKIYNIKTILLGGGVAANIQLRKILSEITREELPGVTLFLPDNFITGDNALMTAVAAYLSGRKKAPSKIGAEANVRL